MTMITPPATYHEDLSQINNLKDLRQEIRRVKAIVHLQEKELGELAKKLPEEAAFAAANGVIHIAVKKGVPSNIFNLVRNGIGLVVNIKKDKKGLRGIVTQGKELIVYTALNRLLQIYQRNRQRKKSASEYRV